MEKSTVAGFVQQNVHDILQLSVSSTIQSLLRWDQGRVMFFLLADPLLPPPNSLFCAWSLGSQGKWGNLWKNPKEQWWNSAERTHTPLWLVVWLCQESPGTQDPAWQHRSEGQGCLGGHWHHAAILHGLLQAKQVYNLQSYKLGSPFHANTFQTPG